MHPSLAAHYGHYADHTPFSERSNYRGRRGERDHVIEQGMRVFAYRNLNVGHLGRGFPKDSVIYSLRDRNGMVFHHALELVIRNATLKVAEGKENSHYGWRAIRANNRKNVHAGVQGTLISWGEVAWPETDGWTLLRYDPYRFESFMAVDHDDPSRVVAPVREAEIILMGSRTRDDVPRPYLLARNPR